MWLKIRIRSLPHQVFLALEVKLYAFHDFANDVSDGLIGLLGFYCDVKLAEKQDKYAVLGIDQRMPRLQRTIPVYEHIGGAQ
jgi:hypothetical protein